MSICSFFPPASEVREARLPAKKRGRPPKAMKTGRPPKAATAATPASSTRTTEVPASRAASVPAPKETRVNWAKPENAQRLEKAMHDWEDKSGPFLSDMPEMAMHTFARCVGIPKSVLHGYMHPDPNKRKSLGAHVGRPALLKPEVQGFVVDVLRRRDRGNEGMGNQEAASMIVDLIPNVTTLQVR
jgi:hypothetical protein